MDPPIAYANQKLLAIIHQTPVGVVEIDPEGVIQQINAKGVQLLMPFFLQHQLAGDNLLTLLELIAPDLKKVLESDGLVLGTILHRKHIVLPLQIGSSPGDRHFWFTINRQEESGFTFFFDDITEVYLQEQSYQQVLLEKAVQEGKFEMASGILHDIGNAVVAFGSYLTRVGRLSEAEDSSNLKKLLLFFNRHRAGFDSVIGESRAGAITTLLDGTIENLTTHDAALKQAVKEQLGIISHIQEILAIQRQYVRDNTSGMARPLINLRSVVNDCLAMLSPTFEKQGIRLGFQVRTENPRMAGDRTKIMQVILNLLKNSQESLRRQASDTKQIDVVIERDTRQLTVTISDNGAGFDPPMAEQLFIKGVSAKAEGTGLGLANCRQIVESHGGTLVLHSAGVGLGAVACAKFSLSPNYQTL
jgi:nitrogen fixation/metabolism regulation signal transduction histidine kinase